MYNEQLEQLIEVALADGVLTEKERQVLFKKAQADGIDLDEFEMVIEARLLKMQKGQQADASKSNKYGDVRKCPSCGSVVRAFRGVCQECGYEFTNLDANLSSKLLAEALLKETIESRKIEVIETFPIPNTKADLLEFLTSLKPRLMGKYNVYSEAYLKKYQECIEKAKIAFDGDKQLQRFIDDYSVIEDHIKTMRLKKKGGEVITWMWDHKFASIVIIIIVLNLISSILF